jgi:hypothetical protein
MYNVWYTQSTVKLDKLLLLNLNGKYEKVFF